MAPDGITLTERAAAHIRHYLARMPQQGQGLRVRVKPSGCSGYRYQVEGVSEIGADDRVFQEHGVRVVVDSGSLAFIAGCRIDYRREGLNATLHFDNPNATALCGCGESFSIQDSIQHQEENK